MIWRRRWRWGRRHAEGVVRLSDLGEGEEGRVARLEISSEVHRKLVEMGLTPGTAVTVVRRMPGGTLEVLARDVVIAVSQEVASGIYVSVER